MQLPRFLLEKSYMLRDILQTLNITTVFQDEAEIVEMGAKGPRLTQVTVVQLSVDLSVHLSVCPSIFLSLLVFRFITSLLCPSVRAVKRSSQEAEPARFQSRLLV